MKAEELKTGDKIRIKNTLIYGIVDMVFDSQTIYVWFKDEGILEMEIDDLAYPVRKQLKSFLKRKHIPGIVLARIGFVLLTLAIMYGFVFLNT